MWIRSTVVFAIFVLASGSVVFAQSANENSIGLEEAIAFTVERNPALVALGYQFEAQRGRIRQAELTPNPLLDFEVENFGGTGRFSDLGGTETTLSLQWILERGKREGRTGVANAQMSLLEAEASIERLDAAAETARLYLNSLEYQALLELAEESVTLYERLTTAAGKRVNAGRSPSADLARAEAALAEQRLVLEDYEHSLAVAIRRLAAQWGETEPTFTRVRGNPQSLPRPVAFSILRERIERNPNLNQFLSDKRLREAELRLAELRGKPDWRVRAGVRHLEQTGDQALLAGITIPLGRNRNQGRIAEARASLAMNDVNRAAERVRIETELFAAYQELSHELHIAETFRDAILPRVEKALIETEQAYIAGRYSYLELRIAQDDALNARTTAVIAAINANRNLIEIERLTGTTLNGQQ